MRRYLYFLNLGRDPLRLEARLNRLAQKGLELSDPNGLLSGEFVKTSRNDLSYAVFPFGASKYAESLEDGDRFGYRLVGGFNGMAIYTSLPCAAQYRAGLLEKLRADGCLHENRWGLIFWIFMLLALSALCSALSWGLYGGVAWLLSYRGLALRGMAVLFMAVFGANLFTLGTRVSGWVHGLTVWVLPGGGIAAFCLALLDDRANTPLFLLLLLAVGVACALALWWRNRALALAPGAFALLILCLGLIFPNVSQADPGGVSLHRAAEDFPVVRLSDLWEGEIPQAAGLTVNGTVLVRVYDYWEVGTEHSVSSQSYLCLTPVLRQAVMNDLSRNIPALAADDGTTRLIGEKNRAALVEVSQPLTDAQWESAAQRTLLS